MPTCQDGCCNDANLARRTSRAARDLARELRGARSLLGSEMNAIVDAVIRCLEGGDFGRSAHDSKFEVVDERLAMLLLEEVLGVSTTLREVYSDAGCIEYELSVAPRFTARGQTLRRVADAMHAFTLSRDELVVRQSAEIAIRQMDRR